jgi:hypothetical protein
MQLRPLYTALALACSLTLSAQTSNPSTKSPAKRDPFQPAAQQAPGAAPNKVWVNLTSHVYHCPTDRYYGRTKHGQYMTEAAAKAAGAHGPRGETCFK